MPIESQTSAEGASLPPAELTIDAIFTRAEQAGASDIHLLADRPPLGRYDGKVETIEGYSEKLSAEQIQDLIAGILSEKQFNRFKEERELDFSYQLQNRGVRFRVNIHYERDHMGLVARVIPHTIPTMDEIFLPDIAHEIIKEDRGIILCTGPTGSGKSTTLAALIAEIKSQRPIHIITLEDPIEFMYESDTAIVRQRQFGTDFLSFDQALKHVLRQDPDVILVGEMRDLETIAAALTLAETGHLVLATLHTNNAAQTIDRIIDVFPPHQQSQIRTQLSATLKAVISQRLIPKEGGGRVAIREILLNNPAVANIIRDNRIAELFNVLQTSAEEGMMTFERDVARLYGMGLVPMDVANQYVEDKSLLKQLSKELNKGQKKGFFG